MASNYTEHYGLCQWDAADQVLREEFNQDNKKIDGALATIPQLVFGSYVGNGSATRKIELGFTPSVLFVVAKDGMTFREINGSSQFCGGLVFKDEPALDVYRDRMILEICENGFHVAYNVDNSLYLYTNEPDMKYHYIALR